MRRCFIGLLVVLLAGGSLLTLPALADGSAVGEACRHDLAKRLGMPEDRLTTRSVTPTVFPDASLLLPRIGEMAAMVQTPGFVVVVDAAEHPFLYTATEKSVRFGGPLDSWADSLLYVAPRQNDPNLNGDLMELSLAGTNPRKVLEGVDGFTPQRDGSILAKRRMSRSGYVLLYLSKDAKGDAEEVGGAFDFGDAKVNPDDHKGWAAIARRMIGAEWNVVHGVLGAEPGAAVWTPTPDGMTPMHVYWDHGRIVVTGRKGGAYRLGEAGAKEPWEKLDSYAPPEAASFLLNKSESLAVNNKTVDGHPETQVVREWFTGDENPIATIPGLQYDAVEITPSQHFVLVKGDADETRKAYVVGIAQGEAMEVPAEAAASVHLRPAPPAAWSQLEKLLH